MPPRLISALSLPALFAAASVTAQECPAPGPLTDGLAGPIAIVRYLADDALEGRLAGSAGERCAADYIADRMRALGLAPAGDNGTWFQEVPLASTLNPHAPSGTGRNVIGILEGSDPALAREIIVIGAHYDHLGHGGTGSLTPGMSAVHNGADDNASGVAALLQTAAALAATPRTARSILFIAFTGEESGLLGSAHYTRQPTLPGRPMRAMLNMDMVGRLEGRPLIVYGVGTASEWTALLEPAAREAGVELALRPEGYGPSDHTSFYTSDVPVLHFFTNTHADYHSPTDDWDRIDADGLDRVARLVTHVAAAAASPGGVLTLQRGAGEPPRPAAGGSGAWLGTVPDFTPVDRGVLLGGVTPGSPAERAGLQKGDVLIGLGGRTVADLEGFTEVLRAHRPGDDIEVVVLREGRELRMRATLGSRGG